MRSPAQDVEGGIGQKVDPVGRHWLSRIGFFEHFDNIAAQTVGTAGPVGIDREPFQAGDQQAQELELLGLGGGHG